LEEVFKKVAWKTSLRRWIHFMKYLDFMMKISKSQKNHDVIVKPEAK
jgi:hypothetical protein